MPRCTPSLLCVAMNSSSTSSTHAAPAHRWPNLITAQATSAVDEATRIQRGGSRRNQERAIVICYNYNASRVRFWYQSDPFRSYLNAMRLISRLLFSLADARTRLPVHLLLSGERYPHFEAELVRAFGVRLTDARHEIKVPGWASHFHKGSFAKLEALSLFHFRRVVALDADMVVLKNIDHLAFRPAPAFVFRFKCFLPPKHTIWEMNSGLMVLQPNERVHQRMLNLMNGGGTILENGRAGKNVTIRSLKVNSDPGEQSVWRSFFSSVHELPVGYNTFKKSNFEHASDWADVSILHDTDVHRGHKIPFPSVQQRYENLTERAARFVAEMSTRLGIVNRG
jgi:hypothetical protein